MERTDEDCRRGMVVFGTALDGVDVLRMWHLDGHVCYAESDDGTTWTNPRIRGPEAAWPRRSD